jgi:hypothetical protein
MIEGQLRLREQFHYPPYGQYLAVGPITLPSDEVQKRMTAQRDIFESYDPQILNIAKPTNMLPTGLFITLKVPDEEILPRLALIEKIDLLRLPGYVVYGM